MAHPDSDGAAEMLEGGHRAMATAAMRLAELYAGRMQIHARLRERQARAASATDQRHADIAAAATQTLNTAARRTPPNFTGQGTDSDQARAEAIRDVPLDEFTQAHQQAVQELAGTGTGVAAADEDAVIRRQFEILESEAFVRAVLDDQEQWEARRIAASTPDRTAHRSDELAAAEVWLARTAPADFATYRATQVGQDTSSAETAQENLVNRYESTPHRPAGRGQYGPARLRLGCSTLNSCHRSGPWRLRPGHHRKRDDHRPGLRHPSRRLGDPRRHQTPACQNIPEPRHRTGTPNSRPLTAVDRPPKCRPAHQ